MKNTKEEKRVYTLLNTRAWLDFTEEDFKDWCNDMEKNPEEEDFDQWRQDECMFSYECDRDNIKYHKDYDAEFVITGSLGLWNGRPSIMPTRVHGLLDAIDKCIGRSIEDIEVTLNEKEGVVYVNAMHHDGTNCFEIHQLRDYCIDAFEREIDNKGYEAEVKNGWFKKIKMY